MEILGRNSIDTTRSDSLTFANVGLDQSHLDKGCLTGEETDKIQVTTCVIIHDASMTRNGVGDKNLMSLLNKPSQGPAPATRADTAIENGDGAGSGAGSSCGSSVATASS